MKFSQGKITGLVVGMLVLASGWVSAQKPATPNQTVEEMISYPVQQAPKVNTIRLSDHREEWAVNMRNTKIVRAPGEDVARDEYAKAKAEANRIKAEIMQKEGNQAPAGKTSGTNIDAPTTGYSFFGNYADEIPNDNSITMGSNGYVISATNSRVFTFKTTGGGATSVSTLASFYSSSNLVFDPKLTYDKQWGRYVLVYLNGDNSSTSRVVIAFSETADPNGNWNVYTITGNPDAATFGSTWADYPQIGINGKELFVTVNLFSNSNSSVGAYVYQINKVDGYTGAATLNWKGWGQQGTSYFAMYPAEGCSKFYSPNMYLVSSRSSPFGASSQFWLHEITDTLTSSTVAFKTTAVSGNLTYSIAPDASQLGSTQGLDTRDCRVRGCMYENGKIYLGMNASANGKAGIYIGVMEGIDQPAFAFVDGTMLRSDTMEMAYPGFACGGCDGPNGDNTSLIFFDMASANHYPGTAVVFMDSTGIMSAPVICKKGATYIKMTGTGPSRWGDYAELAVNPVNPGEAYGAGYYGYSPTSHLHGTWITQVYSPCAPVVSNDPGVEPAKQTFTLFPNPTSERVKMEFTVPATGLYDAELFNLNGEKIRLLMHDQLFKGEGMVSFETTYLQAGTYLVKVSNENGPIFSEKLVVVH
ncbi:MAG: T9SS type A sorting domain-containing protein [Bacteroidia bacterium]|nr:T9SS type A sorting domain-containing protein [Bacteroidia bacterium]